MKIIYLPLESYPERYTYQLQEWTLRRFAERNINIISIAGDQLPSAHHIRSSVALDPAGRSFWGLTQMARVIEHLDTHRYTRDDAIYMQDMYQPGYSALVYTLSQMPYDYRPRLYTHCLAQSVDVNDFTFPFRHWMRHYELMVDQTVDGNFVASTCHADMLKSANFNAPIHVVGLAFDMYEVRERVQEIKPLKMRSKRVIFASRFDKEKQPHFFMDFAEKFKKILPHYQVVVATGQPHLRSNDAGALERAHTLYQLGKIEIREGLTKNQYYKMLADSRLHVNTALQDFVSNTLNEASALGTPSLCPAYLSFPEALNNNRRQLYIPWSVEDMLAKAIELLNEPPDDETIGYSARKQHQTLDNVIDRILKERMPI